MPIIRHKGQHGTRLIYFAHVPKCAGTAVSRYVTERTGPMALFDTGFLSVPHRQRWSKSSPQHIPIAALARLFPPGFFDASFAVIRDPVDRIAAVYLFQRDKEGSIPADLSFEDWLLSLADLPPERPFIYDNHIRPMVDFIPDDAVVFRIEDGLEGLRVWLDETLDLPADPAHAQIPRINTRYRWAGKDAARLAISAPARALVAERFAADYERFGYDS